MPTITVHKHDLERLLGAPVDLGGLEQELELAKAELKGYDPGSDELKVELNDTNRPDLWSPAGIARQLRARRQGQAPDYACFAAARDPEARAALPRILVDPALREIRPFVAGFLVAGAALDDTGLRALIQSQEKLAENYGRKRRAVAIGAYRAPLIRFPIHYRAADPQATRFVPLEFDTPLTLDEILEQHPKGREYGHLLRPFARYPLLCDDQGEVLSMPPVINSNQLGQVVAGDAELFVEVTGNDLRQLLLAINIAAVDFADRGAQVQPVLVEYPYETPFGRQVVTPLDFATPTTLRLPELDRMLGVELQPAEVTAALAAMGHRRIAVGEPGAGGDRDRTATLTPPPYRDDLLHAVDVIEDVAIARNLNSLAPILPRDFTVGQLSDTEELCRQVRDHLLGAGFQEAILNVLTSKEALCERMRLPDDGRVVEIENVMSGKFAALRNSLIPSLLGVEAVSSKALYPHRVFEIGEAVQPDPEANLGTRTGVKVAALLAHPKATFSELQAYLEALAFYMVRDYTLRAVEQPSFMEGRVGAIERAGRAVGLIGEVHPECLERWGITVPVSVLELDLEGFCG